MRRFFGQRWDIYAALVLIVAYVLTPWLTGRIHTSTAVAIIGLACWCMVRTMRAQPLWLRRLQARCLNPRSPHIGTCGRCQRNWRICQSHSTSISKQAGVFPLCQECWQELSIAQRLPYYRAMWDEWQQWGENDLDEWTLIEQAVKRGL